MDRQMRIRFQNLIKLRSAARLWEQSSWKTAKWSVRGRLEPMISGKQLLLFGSYGWGDGEWMRDWCQRMEEAGAHLICEEGVIANETPDDAALEECRAAGKELITASV